MKRYDSYKDSGVEWIGEVPSHWEVCCFKRCMGINNGSDYKHIIAEDGYPVIGSGGPFAYATQYMYDGEVVMLGRKGTIDKPMYYNGKFWAVDTMFYATPNKNIHCKYMYYTAKTIPFNYYSTATALPSMTQSDLGNNLIVCPPFNEQHAIASYLDKKCGEIDKVIETQQKRIELLKELRQSVITRAVTRGINPDAPLKDSGVEWIGKVPSHWEVVPLKYLINKYKAGPFGSSLITSNLLSEGDVLVYTPEHIAKASVYLDNNLYLPNNRVAEMSQFLVEPGDIIIPIVGSLGRAMQVTGSMPKGIINQRISKFKVNNYRLLNEYLLLLINRNGVYDDYFNVNSRGSIIVNLTKEIVGNIPIILPSIEEQYAILDNIERETKSLDSAIDKAQRQIDLLTELKQSIITEVVTGKRKVC